MCKPYILIVDDEPINQMAMQSFLEERFKIRTANNGQECLDYIAIRVPDLILMDIQMPVLNGIEACKKIRKNKHTNQIAVIFISTLTSEKNKKSCFQAGGNAYFTKPVSKHKLIEKIEFLLTNKI
ncbi:MAG: response regulator [Pseudomonadota bacterium]